MRVVLKSMRSFREAEDKSEHVAENSRCPSEADICVSCLVQYKVGLRGRVALGDVGEFLHR